MKGTLEFTLPEEGAEFLRAARAGQLLQAVEEFGEYLRGQEKYVEPAERDGIRDIRARWFAIFGDLIL